MRAPIVKPVCWIPKWEDSQTEVVHAEEQRRDSRRALAHGYSQARTLQHRRGAPFLLELAQPPIRADVQHVADNTALVVRGHSLEVGLLYFATSPWPTRNAVFSRCQRSLSPGVASSLPVKVEGRKSRITWPHRQNKSPGYDGAQGPPMP